MSTSVQIADALVAAAAEAMRRAAAALLELRDEEGYWRGELTADTTLESDYILLQLWLHPPPGAAWSPPRRDRIDRAAESILARQRPDGGFWIYPDGPTDLNATIKAYFALKLAGLKPDDERLRAARDRIVQLGGLPAANSYTKINLSLLGLYPAELAPSVPVEMMLMPCRFIYQMSAWTRTIVIPLSIVQALRPARRAPEGFDLSELVPGDPPPLADSPPGLLSWRNFFRAGDWCLKRWERHGPRRVRGAAVRRAEAWMIERIETSDGLGAIFPAMMYSLMALDALGYAPDDPIRRRAEEALDELIVDDGGHWSFEPCLSPVWDTAMAACALGAADEASPVAFRRTADWLLDRQIHTKGDWSVKRPGVEPGGWCFEYANEFYPDIDDTAMVLLALEHLQASDGERQAAAVRRGVEWLVALQSRDGGWAAFDADNNWQSLAAIPFADHNAMLDPTCPDITGRVLEALCRHGMSATDTAVRRGVEYLIRTQRMDGSWYGRWGVNHIYGTCWAVRGLIAAGESDREAHILRAGEWLRSIQNADGGWGESCASYATGEFEPGPSTPSQTAWALLGLIGSGDGSSDSVQRGVRHLTGRQNEDGTWSEALATGTGFPQVFYLRYDLYRNYFPLMALATFVHNRGRGEVL